MNDIEYEYDGDWQRWFDDLGRLVNGSPKHDRFRRGPTFFRSGSRWWRDDGHGHQFPADDVVGAAS